MVTAKLKKVVGKEYQQLSQMYKAYTIELFNLVGYNFLNGKINDISPNPKMRDDYFIVNEKDEIVGFCLIGKYPNSHSEKAIYIGEFCILPMYRGRYYGRFAVKEIANRYRGKDICLDILNANSVAKAFWNNVLTDKLNYKQTFVFPNRVFHPLDKIRSFKYYSSEV